MGRWGEGGGGIDTDTWFIVKDIDPYTRRSVGERMRFREQLIFRLLEAP